MHCATPESRSRTPSQDLCALISSRHLSQCFSAQATYSSLFSTPSLFPRMSVGSISGRDFIVAPRGLPAPRAYWAHTASGAMVIVWGRRSTLERPSSARRCGSILARRRISLTRSERYRTSDPSLLILDGSSSKIIRPCFLEKFIHSNFIVFHCCTTSYFPFSILLSEYTNVLKTQFMSVEGK